MNQLQHAGSYVEEILAVIHSRRKTIGKYLVIFLPLGICLAMIGIIDSGTGSNTSLKILQLISFSFMGWGYLYLLKTNHYINYHHLLQEGVVYVISIAGGICISLLFFYLLINNSMALMAIASSAAFSIPYFIFQGWLLFTRIPDKVFEVWMKPAEKRRVEDVFLPSTLTVTFSVSRKYFDTQDGFFSKNCMEHVSLGEAFYAMLLEENKNSPGSIQQLDEKKTLFGWEFYTPRFYNSFKKRLDPEASFSENGIRDNAIIHVKRLRQRANL